MNAPIRISPLSDRQIALAARTSRLAQMEVVASFGQDDAAKLAVVGIGDLTFRRRAGVKGRGAHTALNDLGIATPDRPNTFLHLDDGTLVARLGMTEYLIEDAAGGLRTAGLMAQVPAAGVYPVPRFDAALLIAGSRAPELLRQTCAFDFSALTLPGNPLAMTSMVGVGVTAIALEGRAGRYYRLWCDGTYGGYLWATLVEVAMELGGGAVGFEALGPLAK